MPFGRKKGLTVKQQLFVDEFLVDGNATQAYIRAGYKGKNPNGRGSELLHTPNIADLIAKAQRERSERVRITQDEVVRGLKKEATMEGEGSSHSARVAAWAHLGKHLGMFVEKSEVKNFNITISKKDADAL